MRLLNTNRRIPGGWRYEQLDVSGKLMRKFQSWNPWMMFLQEIQAFRKTNHMARQNIDFIEADVTEYLAREFGGDPKYFTTDPAQKKTTVTSRYQSQRAARLVARGKQLLTGIEIVKDWLGDGLKPVEQEVAQSRADICTGRLDGKACPHNQPGFAPVESVAAIIRKWSESKNEMKLEVIGEDTLHTCQICFCSLPTKIWCPIDTISGQTPDAMFDKFASEAPENCWMRKQKTTNPV